MIYIGIDPGKKGGIAVMTENKTFVYPFSEENLFDMMDYVRDKEDELSKCVLEKVGAMPGQGVTSMFNFGQNFGFIQGVLRSYGISYELVTPQKWKKEFSVTKDKNTSIEVAKRLFPLVNLKATERCKKDHDGMAEALLLAEYCRRNC